MRRGHCAASTPGGGSVPPGTRSAQASGGGPAPAGAGSDTPGGGAPASRGGGEPSSAGPATALAGSAGVRRGAGGAAPPAVRRSEEPGADDETRTAAAHQLRSAQERVEAAARRTAAVLDDAEQGAPHEPGLLSKAVHAAGSFLAGAGEATWGLVELAVKLSPTYALIDPEGFLDYTTGLGKGIAYGVTHPVDLGKSLIDYDTWRTDPARALGHLVPDLLLAVATAGTGEAGVAGARTAEGAEAVEDVATHGVRAAAQT